MKLNKLYGLILAVSVLLLSACNDTKENPAGPSLSGPYSFFNVTTPKKITKYASQGTEISLQLLKHGLAAPGETVQIIPFDNKYGEVDSLVAVTDANGIAVFTFIAPEGDDFTELKGQDFTITVIFEDPEVDTDVVTNSDAPPNIILTQEIVLQFR